MASSRRAVAVIDLGDHESATGLNAIGRFAPRKLAGHPLLIRMARRLSEAACIDGVIVTGNQIPMPTLTCGVAGIEILDLPHSHLCDRLAAAADRCSAEWVVYVPGNRPFVDPVLIDSLVKRCIQTDDQVDYVGFCGTNGDWDRIRHLGVAGEVCHSDTLRRLRRNLDRIVLPKANGLTSPQIQSHDVALADWLDAAPGQYAMQWVPIPAALDHQDFRFTIEDESDWEWAELFADYLCDDHTEWQMLAELVRDNQTLRGAMADRNRIGQTQF